MLVVDIVGDGAGRLVVVALVATNCVPYHCCFFFDLQLSVATLKTVKLASTKYHDDLVTTGSGGGRAFRDLK